MFTPDMNNGRNVFVFGSNEAGNHAGGAARVALLHWGAVMGCGVGPTGNSYALPTMSAGFEPLPLSDIAWHVEQFIAFAKLRPSRQFLVTAVGCGIAGFSEAEIAPLFKDAPKNCVLPKGWRTTKDAQ